MSSSASECIEQLNSVIEDCETYDFITRDSDLQKRSCQSLYNLLGSCASLKEQAIAKNYEDFANVLLGFECVASSLIGTLSMWVFLKEGKPDEAWDQLIKAQTAATYAAKADSHFAHLLERAKKLEQIERLVFPEQVFVSAGLIVGRQDCSICGSEYGECEHLAGKPYWGKFCCIVARDLKADHVAVVQDPADKRCRIRKFSVAGGNRNRMTWRVEPSDSLSYPEPEVGDGSNNQFQKAEASIIYASEP